MKFMNLKRFASVAMAGAMALSLMAPAFATDPPANTTVVSGTYEEIPISVAVPTTGTASINPYGLPVTITKPDEKTVDLVGQKITTQPLSIRNQGTTALNVGATLAVLPKGEVSIAAAADTDKAIKVDLEVVGLNEAALAVASDNAKLESAIIDRFANKDTWNDAATLAAPVAAANATSVTPAESDPDAPLARLGEAVVKGDVITYNADSIALFRLNGDCAQSPKTSGTANPWEAADGFEATIVFKFTPAGPSAGDAAITLAFTGTTATATFAAGTSGLTVTSLAWTDDGSGNATVSGATTLTGTTATATITDGGLATSGDETEITVTATLSNGATISATETYTKA